MCYYSQGLLFIYPMYIIRITLILPSTLIKKKISMILDYTLLIKYGYTFLLLITAFLCAWIIHTMIILIVKWLFRQRNIIKNNCDTCTKGRDCNTYLCIKNNEIHKKQKQEIIDRVGYAVYSFSRQCLAVLLTTGMLTFVLSVLLKLFK